MTLPIPQLPLYETVLPLSKKVVKYRPFIVKEEKIMLLAISSKDEKEILDAMRQIIRLATENTVEPDNIPLSDLNYLMIKIRAASKGNMVELALKCKNDVDGHICGFVNEMQINLDEAVPTNTEIETKFSINAEMGIVMKYISFDVTNIDRSKSEVEQKLEAIINNIDYVYDKDEIYKRSDYSTDELLQFLDMVPKITLDDISEFVENQPGLKIDIDYKCGGCGIERKIEVDNIQDFL